MRKPWILMLSTLSLVMLSACSGNNSSSGSSTDHTYLYNATFPYYGQSLSALAWTGNPDPTFAQTIQHLSRSTNTVWTEASPWDGDDSEVHLSAFIASDWGRKTVENWYPRLTTVESPLTGETSAVYWPRVSMNADLVQYWHDLGLTKVYHEGAVNDLTDDYYVYYPNGADQDASGKYPLIILFHGGGEAALQAETFGFGPIAIQQRLFMVAAESFASGTDNVGNIDTILSQVLAAYPMIDKERIYAIGSSMGGSSASLFANTHTTTVAAAGVMDQPLSLNTIANNPAPDQQIADIQANGMPVVYLGGLSCMYALWNIRNHDYFYSHEGSAPNSINTHFPDYVSGFNRLMAAYGVTGKNFTDISTRQAYADAAGAPEMTYYTGYPFDSTTIDSSHGLKVYKGSFSGQGRLLAYAIENRPHMPSGYDAQLIWDFVSQWKRDLTTGQSVKR